MVIGAAFLIVLLAGWFGWVRKLTGLAIISFLIIALMIAIAVMVPAPDNSREFIKDRSILILFGAVGLGLAWLSYGVGMTARWLSHKEGSVGK